MSNTASHNRRIGAELSIPEEERIARDLVLLRTLGRVKTWEYAERMGISVATAKTRLARLHMLGKANRTHERGQHGWTYEAKP